MRWRVELNLCFNARPHLLSSPPGRGNGCGPFLVLRMVVRQIQSREFSRGRWMIHPLLGGEGRGEDGRSTILIYVLRSRQCRRARRLLPQHLSALQRSWQRPATARASARNHARAAGQSTSNSGIKLPVPKPGGLSRKLGEAAFFITRIFNGTVYDSFSAHGADLSTTFVAFDEGQNSKCWLGFILFCHFINHFRPKIV